MTYRIQDILRLIIPGLYLLGGVFSVILYANWADVDKYAIGNVCNFVKDFSPVIILLFPFVGFVAGYFVECIMAIIERIIYFIGIPRPSWIVLNQYTGMYYFEKVYLLRGKSSVKSTVARNVLQKAKQSINKELVENFYYNSIMARNIAGSQLIISTYLSVSIKANDWIWLCIAWGVSLLFLLFWYHHNCVYVKYIFAEYAEKTRESKNPIVID